MVHLGLLLLLSPHPFLPAPSRLPYVIALPTGTMQPSSPRHLARHRLTLPSHPVPPPWASPSPPQFPSPPAAHRVSPL